MLTEAAGLALLAAITPTALLVAAVFLGAANPRRNVLIFLAGAVVMTAVMATIVFVVLRAGHVYKPSHRHTRYGVRLGLGVLLLAAGAWLWRRGPKQKDPAKQGQGIISRMIAHPSPRAAFITGILVYSPSLTFVAAVQVVATSRESTAESVGSLALIIVITLLLVWIPLVLFLLTPERTGRLLHSFNRWLRSHGRILVLGAMVVAGAALTANGIYGLV
ncbi:MAG TPA: GAP family protein [Streptosporangiaceae bacterium]|jgi:threonine/homoserine/homoserine lactone efflux protein|nr:GAP family protein [Streptosporangiaceae bacterium]